MAQTADELIPTRTTLLKRLKDWRDDSSWQDFFETYWRLIHGVAVKGGLTNTEAEDVVQETMFAIAKQMPDFKYEQKSGSFKSWLLNMTRWRIADQLRKRQIEIPLEISGDTQAEAREFHRVIDPASEDMARLWNAEWEKNLWDAAIAKIKRRLEPQKFQIFDLCVNKEWRPEKVADIFSITIDQVYLDKHRATEMIKEEIKKINRETN